MLIITLQVDAPIGSVQGVKETLAMYMERFGDTKITSVKEISPEQMRFDAQRPNVPPNQSRRR